MAVVSICYCPLPLGVRCHPSGNALRAFSMGIPAVGDRVAAFGVGVFADCRRRPALGVLAVELRGNGVSNQRQAAYVESVVLFAVGELADAIIKRQV